MSWWDYLKGIGNALMGRTSTVDPPRRRRREPEPYQHYGSLDSRYENKDYEEIVELLKDTGDIPREYAALKSLRNPVPRVCDVYAANLMAGDILEYLESPEGSSVDVTALKPLLKRIYAGSEWEEEIRRAFPGHGEYWLKAVGVWDSSPERRKLYPQVIDPRHVTDFSENERGYLTYLRLDIPEERRTENGETEPYLHIEVWDKGQASYRVYHVPESKGNPGDNLSKFDTFLVQQLTLGVSRVDGDDGYTGYDFVPVIHQRFRRMLGKKRGITPYEHALPNIDRLNELVTKLHTMLFPDIYAVISREGAGPDGEPLPPIQVEGLEAQAALTEAERQGFKVIEINHQKVIRLPSGVNFDWKIPGIDFGSHLSVIEAEVHELEQLLIELSYYRLRELQLSGYAIELSLKDLIDRLKAARQNFERGLVRFNQMAITIGQVLEIPGFETVGTFKDGALEHTFGDRDIFLPPVKDRVETDNLRAQVIQAYAQLGPTLLEEILIKQGYPEDIARTIAGEVEASTSRGVPPLNLASAFGLGNNTPPNEEG